MKRVVFIKALMFSVIVFISCDKFEFDPNQSLTVNTETDLNSINVNKILSTPGDNTLTIALIGDSHTYYEDMEEVVEAINAIPEVDFVVHAGDITDHGYIIEFNKGVSILKKLNKPYVTVVGNHDLLANGGHIYQKMFGPFNFSFIYKGVKFIFFDSNGREYGFPGNVPDLDWVSNEISSKPFSDKIVLVSHVPYFNSDYNPYLVAPYKNMLNSYSGSKEILISMSGHQHVTYSSSSQEITVPHIGPGSIKEGYYYLITIKNNYVTYEKRTN